MLVQLNTAITVINGVEHGQFVRYDDGKTNWDGTAVQINRSLLFVETASGETKRATQDDADKGYLFT